MQYFRNYVPKRSETKPNSIWILWSDEPPTLVDYAIFKSYRFNWTISFKLNSEVSLGSYGLFTKRKSLRTNSDHSLWIDQQFHHRSNAALWFVSNCDAKERLEYYRILRHEPNTSVEGYGRCVDYYPMHFCVAGSQCEKDYMSKFKYYLSFESMTCRDYITEKFFKAFYHGLIPIVYGPDRIDYERFAPAQSFIHINDFNKDMNKLANYLQEIHRNFTLYSMYHQWRKTYEVIIDGKALERIRMCELCERLNKVRRGDVTYYEDIEQFYHEKC
jgi:glycoprotein 3-alpha-L-fucosyltransferase